MGQYQRDPKLRYDCLLFDVDDTLYSLNSGLSAACSKNIKEYMVQKLGIEEDKVSDMNQRLYKEYGTTMAGLKAIGYKFDVDDFHQFAHGRLPYELLKPDPVLRNLLLSLPIRKLIFSNGNKAHVATVVSRLRLEGCFEGIVCFETLNPRELSNGDGAGHGRFCGTGFFYHDDAGRALESPIVCKPFEDAFKQAFKIAGIIPHQTLFFDDSVRNIQTGKEMGLHTVLVGTSHRVKGADHALESIHNIREALPELWEGDKIEEGSRYSKEIAIETPVTA